MSDARELDIVIEGTTSAKRKWVFVALALGASAVWVGTRFVASAEAGAPPRHQREVLSADYHDTVRTIIFTGRPMRVKKNDFISESSNGLSQRDSLC